MKAFVLFPILLLSIPAVNAATLIEREDSQMGSSKMWVDGNNMRAQVDNGSYMLMNFKRKQMYIVNTPRREIIDASEMMKNRPAAAGLKVEIKRSGKGPVIAGYSTQKYDLMVNGRRCEQSLVSMKALKDSGLVDMMESMGDIDFDPRGDAYKSPCDKADGIFAIRMKKIGLPLAEINERGQVVDKVLRIEKNSKLPAGGFKRPSGYRTVTMQQMMQNSFGGGMPPAELMQNMTPEQKRMMEQMMRESR